MFGRKKRNISRRYILVGSGVLVIILFVIFSSIMKTDRELNPVESFLKDTIIYVERVVTYPFRFVTDNINEYNKLKSVRKENILQL